MDTHFTSAPLDPHPPDLTPPPDPPHPICPCPSPTWNESARISPCTPSSSSSPLARQRASFGRIDQRRRWRVPEVNDRLDEPRAHLEQRDERSTTAAVELGAREEAVSSFFFSTAARALRRVRTAATLPCGAGNDDHAHRSSVWRVVVAVRSGRGARAPSERASAVHTIASTATGSW